MACRAVVFMHLFVTVLINGQTNIEINNTECLKMAVNIPTTVTIISITKNDNGIVCALKIQEGVIGSSLITNSYKNRINCTWANNEFSVCFLDSVTDADAGVYHTTAANTATTTILHVMKKPRTATITASGDATEFSLLNLTCSSSSTSLPSGFPFTYTWTVDNRPIIDPRYLVTGPGKANFSINTLQKSDHGKHVRCTGTEENGISSSESSAYIIDVKCSPRLSEKQALSVNVVPGENLIINLEILSNPIPSFTDIRWNLHSINGNGTRTITDGVDGFNIVANLATIKVRVVLIKTKITTSDYGKYTVLVRNEIGQLKQDFEVQSSEKNLLDDNKIGNNLGITIFGTLCGLLFAVCVLLVAYIFYMTRKMKHPADKTQQRTGRDVYDELQEAKKDENKYDAVSRDEVEKETSGRGDYEELKETKKDENKYEAISRQTVDSGKNTRIDVNPESAQGDEERVKMYEYPATEQLKLKKIKNTKRDITKQDGEYTNVSSHQR